MWETLDFIAKDTPSKRIRNEERREAEKCAETAR